ncbi:hypothetical protein [Massilibacteroides sp.]|uniref:hypothetical protein n=1 Tax=Massilibacteroides sp. TaxID=2034766 RepID=UPI0026170413|nr:hypothetical protein [Massilibacteroides sp.]MDD4515671.1 hypothetical protein [Massilibacteroides sp.]
MATKIIFYGTEMSKTHETELQCSIDADNDLFIEIYNPDAELPMYIYIDKDTALSFRDRIDKLINEME